MPAESYVGRFAPSPTGPLHFGSLLAATASYLQARANNGRWLVRIEDIDPPREQPGADADILRTLEAYGFEWNLPATYQSHFTTRHEALLQTLISAGHVYPCGCSRRDLADARRGPLGIIYPGTCRNSCKANGVAYRIRTTGAAMSFVDRLQGAVSQRLESESGDFVVKRRDGLIAYHLAVVADDFDQNISEVVRGIDLLDSTPRHIWLQHCLQLPTPGYAHIPIAENEHGQKLSKLTGAMRITTRSADHIGRTLVCALEALRLAPPAELLGYPLADIWQWAILNWDMDALRGRKSIPVDQFSLAC